MVAGRSHNPVYVGSNPTPATINPLSQKSYQAMRLEESGGLTGI